MRLGGCRTRHGYTHAHAHKTQHGELAELPATEPCERRPGRQVYPAAPVPKDVARVQHAPLPRVCLVLVAGLGIIETERTRNNLQAVDGKVKHPEAEDAQCLHDGASACVSLWVPVAEAGAHNVKQERRDGLCKGHETCRQGDYDSTPDHVLAAAVW